MISKGWFNTTLRLSPVQNIAFLRMDGDLYTSTKETIEVNAFDDSIECSELTDLHVVN